MLQGLLDGLAAFQKRLKGRTSVHVNDQETKAAAIALASTYFKDARPSLAEILGDLRDLRAEDDAWQELVRLAHGNNKRGTYLKLVKGLATKLRELSVQTLSRTADRGSGAPGVTNLTPADLQLLSTLEALLPTAAASYRQGLLDLRDKERLSYRGTASEFREALRETLDHLAVDAEVAKQPGFKYEDGQTRPTMKQKARFVLLSRGRSKTQASVAEKAIGVVEGIAGEVVRATYDRAALATHLETTRTEVIRIKRYVDTVLFDLLEIPEAPAPVVRATSR
jgi:hypothetical protein